MKHRLAATCLSRFAPRLRQHIFREIDSHHLVTGTAEWQCVVAGAAPKIQHRSETALVILVKETLNQSRLPCIVLVAVERVIHVCVHRAKHTAHFNTFRIAVHTRSSCSSVNPKPDGTYTPCRASRSATG